MEKKGWGEFNGVIVQMRQECVGADLENRVA
jgi:hypothetical protein